MPRFMMDREVLQPPAFAQHGCVLVRYRLPWLRHCYVLCQEAGASDDAQGQMGTLAFFMGEARTLAQEAVGDPQAFMLIYSGKAIRKRGNLHVHVFVVQRRWQKAWVYTILSAKNFALTAWIAVSGLRRAKGRGPAPATADHQP